MQLMHMAGLLALPARPTATRPPGRARTRTRPQPQLTAAEIEETRVRYSPAAKRGAILFFVIAGLSAITNMYEYSLASFLVVFNGSLHTSRRDASLEGRLRNITESLTYDVYAYTCLGLFERHKLMLSFQVRARVRQGGAPGCGGEGECGVGRGQAALVPLPRACPLLAARSRQAGWRCAPPRPPPTHPHPHHARPLAPHHRPHPTTPPPTTPPPAPPTPNTRR